MKKLYILFSFLFAVSLLSAQVDYADVESIFLNNCASCHGNSGGFTIGYNNMVDQPSTQLPGMDRVEPFDPANSYLFLKITGDHTGAGGSGNSMPPGGSLSSGDIDLIEQWINDGALLEVTGIEDELQASSNASLFQNYPNPVKSQTTIQFNLNQPELVNISVYDLTGKLIATVTEGRYPQGTHTAQWFTENKLDGGMYLIQLTAGREIQTIKTLVVD